MTKMHLTRNDHPWHGRPIDIGEETPSGTTSRFPRSLTGSLPVSIGDREWVDWGSDPIRKDLQGASADIGGGT